MGFYSTHTWADGGVTTVERTASGEFNIRIQDENEQMLVDVYMQEYAAICLAQSILSVVVNPEGIGEDGD